MRAIAIDLVARLSVKDDLSARMRRVTGELGKTEKQTRSLTERMGGLKGMLAGIGVTAGITSIATGVVKAGVEYSNTMSEVAALTGATSKEMELLSGQARQLGKDTVHSATAAASAQAFLGQAGFKTNEILATMPGLLDLATAGQLDLGRAADIASNVMTGFNLKATDMGRIADVLAQAASNANTDVQGMGMAMSYVAPVAASMNVSLEEVAAGVGLLSDAGIQGERAGTALRGIIGALSDPTKALTKKLNAAGLSVKQVSPRFNSMADIIENLTEAGFTAADSLELVGLNSGPGLAALMSGGADALRDFTKEMENSQGAAKKMADIISDNLGADWEIFKSGINEAQLTAFFLVEDSLRGLLQRASAVVQQFPAAIEMINRLAKPFVPLAKAIGVAIGAVAGFFAMVGTFKLIGAGIMFLFSPLGLVIGAITALVLGFQAAYKHSEPFRKAVDSIGQSFIAISKIFNGEHKAAIDILEATGLGPKQIDLIRKFGYGLKDTFTMVSGIVGGVSNIFAGKHKGAIDILSGAGFSPEQVDKIRAFGYGLKDAFDRVVSIFGGIGTLFATGKSSDLLKALGFSPEMIAKISEFVTGVKTKVSEFVAYLGAKWTELQPSIALVIERFFSLKDTAINIFTTLWAFLQPVFSALGNAFRIIGDIAVMVWKNVIAPAVNFVIGVFQALWNIVGPILELLGAAIGLAFGVLKFVWDTIIKPVADYLMGAFATAFEAAMPYVESLSGAFEFLGGVIETIAGWFNTFTSALAAFKVPNWLSKLGGGGTVKFESSEGDGGGSVKSNYHGIDYVPYDGFQTRLHKGESVVTAQENREQKQGGGSGGGISISGNTFHVRQESDIDAIAEQLYQKIYEAGEAGA